MAVKKRKKRGRTSKISSLLTALRRKKSKKQAGWVGPGLTSILKVLVVVCILIAAALGLSFLEKYSRPRQGPSYLELAGVPAWVGTELKEKLKEIAETSGGNLISNEDAAASIRHSIETEFPWLDDVKVLAKQNELRVEGRWRKPLALIRTDQGERRYVDSQGVVLDYVRLPQLPIVEVVGITPASDTPAPGRVWQCDDLAAAMEILEPMNRMDRNFTPDKPLLFQIDRIDVSNFNGRRDEGEPHIVLYTKDNIELIWGAEWGKSQQYLEPRDEEKLANLWEYYQQNNTLSVGVKYINLRVPLDKIPLPIDKR